MKLRLYQGYTLVETMMTLALGSMLFGSLMLSLTGLQHTYVGCGHYAGSLTSGGRLIDSLSTDLRRALRVNSGPITTVAPLRGAGTSYVITDTNILSIIVPDYYQSNTANSNAYHTARYPYPGDPNYLQSTPLTPWGQAKYTDATLAVNQKPTTAFLPPSSGTDELEVRYVRTTRALHDPLGTPGDPTVCVFRQEFKDGTRVSMLANEEIADQIEVPLTASGAADTSAPNNLSVTSQNTAGSIFLMQFSYATRLSSNDASQTASITGNGSSALVCVRNPRRD